MIPTPGAPLFCTRGGGRLTEAYVRRLLPRLAAQAAIDKHVHAHGLRHTHAAELRSEGADIGIISKQLGHASIATTARYVDHIAPLAVVEAITNRQSWAEKLTSHCSYGKRKSPGLFGNGTDTMNIDHVGLIIRPERSMRAEPSRKLRVPRSSACHQLPPKRAILWAWVDIIHPYVPSSSKTTNLDGLICT